MSEKLNFGQLPTTGLEDESGWGLFNNRSTYLTDECPMTEGCPVPGARYVDDNETCFEQSLALHMNAAEALGLLDDDDETFLGVIDVTIGETFIPGLGNVRFMVMSSDVPLGLDDLLGYANTMPGGATDFGDEDFPEWLFGDTEPLKPADDEQDEE